MTASPTALDLARACVCVEEAGPWHHIRIVPPGQELHQAIHWTSAKAEDLPHQRDAVVAMLAPFIDLGMARGRAEGSRLEPLTDQDRHQIAAELLELRAERDKAIADKNHLADRLAHALGFDAGHPLPCSMLATDHAAAVQAGYERDLAALRASLPTVVIGRGLRVHGADDLEVYPGDAPTYLVPGAVEDDDGDPG